MSDDKRPLPQQQPRPETRPEPRREPQPERRQGNEGTPVRKGNDPAPIFPMQGIKK
jgi:hypothetical protein